MLFFCCSYLCEHLVIPLFISDRWTPDRCYFSILTCVNIWSFLCLYRIGGPWPVLFVCCSYLCKHLVIPLFVSDRWTPDRWYFSVVLTCVNIWSFLCLYRIGGPLTGAIFCCSYLCEHLVIPLFISDRWTPDRCYFSVVLTCVNIWSFLCLYRIGGPLTGAIFLLFLPVWTSGHSSVYIG